MDVKGMRMCAALVSLCGVVLGSGLASAAPASAAGAPVMPFRAHQYFDDTTGPPAAGIVRGVAAAPLAHPKLALGGSTATPSNAAATAPQSTPAAPPDPEVLGFVQSGEVSSGSWAADLHFSLLSTIAYFAVNLNPDGTMVTGDSGYATWWSSQETNLINAAHNAGDRVVLTVKAFNDSLIASVTGSEQARQTAIGNIINQVVNRPADGVNVDFEGVSSSLSTNFTTFIAELQSALNARAAGHAYLTVDTYASAGQGSSMYDLASLWHHVDALDLMGYGFEPCTSGDAGPSAPMGGCWYNVTQAVSDYMNRFGVPGSKLLLGVPYYGYKWNVSCPSGCVGQDHTTSGGSADTYSAVLSDLSCAQQLQKHWDSTFQGPWASWYSPAVADPCGGNHGSYRELYYDNPQSLGLKYDLVNNRGLRGIAIWALGYDSGTNDLWNEISAKFTVTKFPPFRPQGVGAPSVTVTPDGSQQLVFWRGFSNHLFEAWYSGGYWHGPIDLTATLGSSAILQSAPSVAVTPDGSTETVFWQGPSGHLFEAWWAGGRWNGPIDLSAGTLGSSGVLGSAPSVAITTDGSTQTVFWEGAGGHLFEAWYAGSWNGPVDWTAAWGGRGVLTSAPSAVTTIHGEQLVFWRGTDGHLWEAWYTGVWNGPADFAPLGTLASAPSAAVTRDDTQQMVFWQAPDSHLTEVWYAGSWNGPVEWTSMGSLSSRPSVAVDPDGSQLVFWQGPAQTLWEAWYAGTWNGPADLSGG
jgi:spore germination protein YaaH